MEVSVNKKNLIDLSGIILGNYTIDIFQCESGNLGLTVYLGNKVDEDTKTIDIFVNPDGKVHGC